MWCCKHVTNAGLLITPQNTSELSKMEMIKSNKCASSSFSRNIIRTRLRHCYAQTVLFKFYDFSADILSLLHILFWLTDSLLPICCHFIITAMKMFRNRYFEYTASYLERRYTQYWFMLIPSLCECSASDLCKLRGIRSLNCPE